MQLTSGTTVLRRLHPQDLVPFLAYRNDPEVAMYQSWDAMDEAQAFGFLTFMRDVQPLMRPGHWSQIAVAGAATNSLLGDMGWHLNAAGDEVELGITLARAAQRQGHATGALALAMEHLTHITEVSRFVAYADLRNGPSRALLRRVGFTCLGIEVAEDGLEEEVFEYRAIRTTA